MAASNDDPTTVAPRRIRGVRRHPPVEAGALKGFRFALVNRLPGSNSQKYCVRDAICHLMGWGGDSKEYNCFPAEVDFEDVRPLALRLSGHGVRWHGAGTAKVVEGSSVVLVLQDPAIHAGHMVFAEKLPSTEGQLALKARFGQIIGIIEKFPPGYCKADLLAEPNNPHMKEP
jgi:hypothetical protein